MLLARRNKNSLTFMSFILYLDCLLVNVLLDMAFNAN